LPRANGERRDERAIRGGRWTEAAASRLAVLDRTPGAARLAALVSLAARVEPAFLRDARVRARLDGGAEADLWFSPVVASAGRAGLVLEASAADLLRKRLVGAPGDLQLARDLLADHHGQAPWSTRLEERINELSITDGSEGDIEELIAAALVRLRTVWGENERAASAIARWLLTWLKRTPAVAGSTPMAATAGVAAGAYLDGRLPVVDGLTEQARTEWLPWLLGRLGEENVSLRLTDIGLSLGREHRPPGIPVPRTDPVVLTAQWNTDDEYKQVEIRLRRDGRSRSVSTGGATEVEVSTLTGERYVVRPAGAGRWITPFGGEVAAVLVAPELALTVDPAGTTVGSELGRYVPDHGAPLTVVGARRGSGTLGVLALALAGPAPGVLPVVAPRPNQRCHIGLMGGPGANATVLSDLGARQLRLRLAAPDVRQAPPGSPVTVAEPWGALIGIVVGQEPAASDSEVVILAASATAVLEEVLPDASAIAAENASEPSGFADSS
jgi:hypothetical protein